MRLPLVPTPVVGETVDGYVLKAVLSEGRYSRLFAAVDEVEGGEAALKFPKPEIAAAATHHAAFVREAWVGARVNSPWIGHVVEPPPGRQTCLYTVMPLYQGELLETRLAGVLQSASRKGAASPSGSPGASRRSTAPASSTATSSPTTSSSRAGIAEADRSRRGAGAGMGRPAATEIPGPPAMRRRKCSRAKPVTRRPISMRWA